MSWAPQVGPNNANSAPGPPDRMYSPSQAHSVSSNQWQSSDPQNWYHTTPRPQYPQETDQSQSYWPQQYPDQQQSHFPDNQRTPVAQNQYQVQPPYHPNVNEYDQQAYGNLAYNQQYGRNSTFTGQMAQPSEDAWSWGWGDEDNSNVQSNQRSANNLGDSFANDESWNWSSQGNKTAETSNQDAANSGSDPNFKPPFQVENKALKIRGKFDTPQWSTESQPSQESSDDILHTSESDKSHIVSRSSTISYSPTSGPSQDTLHSTQLVRCANVTAETENKEIVGKVNVVPLPPNNLQQTPPMQPLGQDGSENSKNPFKRVTNLTHKSSNSFRMSNITPPVSRTPNFPPNNQSANLETLPDNSEHPDHLSTISSAKLTKNIQQWPQAENSEVPINDRNQYLETGQLSNMNLVEGNDVLPPPGLQRMIPGQLEHDNNGVSKKSDRSPGFSRMVLGQTENSTNLSSQVQATYDPNGPPEGLHRMIPGESSSPETYSRQQHLEENDSEQELNRLSEISAAQTRSATIGADTPPTSVQNVVSNRLDAVETAQASGVEVIHAGASISPSDGRIGAKKGREQQGARREFIEGQTNDGVSSLTSSVRNLTVDSEHRTRRHSRQESSDSELESKGPSPRDHRDKRPPEKSKVDRDRYGERERYNDRYSPDQHKSRRDRRDRRYKESRYEEDTDYLSDKERKNRDDRDRDYERKYNSLRKDKDRRRKDYNKDARNRSGDYYYSRFGDEYDNQSRPSSRSDSMHDSYRERRHDRDPRDKRYRDRDARYRPRDHREVFNPYQGFAYDPYNPYYQHYQYYENLRRTNPQAYAEWYRKYYQQMAGSATSYTGDDRASVHSGRSSANDELSKDSQNPAAHSSSIYEDKVQVLRLTPAKFSTAHLKVSITSGKLVQILPNYPMDGQNALVEILGLQNFLEDNDQFIELNSFPGPLVKGVTHKKTIIEYCDNKIRRASYNSKINDVESYVLMWELLILLIRQNGMVVGTDIAELLLKNCNTEPTARPPSVVSNASSNLHEPSQMSDASNQDIGSSQTSLKEEEITKKFREFLLYGSGREALEWAMKHGLWGHALFLASKLDKRTYANVMMRFANGLAINDPLQTLYQLLSGKMPAAVTCIADEKWGDWRPHLAMILSNSTQRPELNCKAITTLGDTLLTRGNIYAAQFCYLMAEVGFSKHGSEETRLVLLGSDHRLTYPGYATNEAIHMTEIYEYACSLNDQGFLITEFQIYKYLLSSRLADMGLLEKSLAYLEKISEYIVNNPTEVLPIFVDQVCTLADRLKFCDPVGDEEDESKFGSILETSRPDHSWLKELKRVQSDYQSGVITQDTMDYPPMENVEPTFQPEKNLWEQQYGHENVPALPVQPEQQLEYQALQQAPQTSGLTVNNYPNSQPYWPGQQHQQPVDQWNDRMNNFEAEGDNTFQDTPANFGANSHVEGYGQQQPQISMPNQQPLSGGFSNEAPPREKQAKKENVIKKEHKSPAKENKQSTGWFGGIFSRFKPKNQMILPDDKNPKIVWDQDKKRWVNVDEDGTDTASEFKPPPKMSELPPKLPADVSKNPVPMLPTQAAEDGTQPKSNMFKLQRGRNLKNSYIDVFNANGANASGPPSMLMSEPAQSAAPPMNFFVPPAVNDPNAPFDFLTPAPPLQFKEQTQET